VTYLKHNRGNHYTEYDGPGWSVCAFLLTGLRWGPLKATPRYKGTRKDIEKRKKKPLWRIR
jgi:hypothetical protein